jgi:hypothetical protein
MKRLAIFFSFNLLCLKQYRAVCVLNY